MKQPIDLAREYLAVADRDIEAFRVLAAAPSVSDASVGFHAQQAVEKCLKAVLALNRVPFGRVHDIQALTTCSPRIGSRCRRTPACSTV
jgi:HEPN domain-containing protein